MGKNTDGKASYSLADMTAASADLEVRGVTIQVNPIPLSEWGRFDKWLREETTRMALRAADELPLALRGQFIREAIVAATGISIASPEALRGMLGSIGGSLRVAWTSLRAGGNEELMDNRKHGLTLQDVERFIGPDINAMGTIVDKVVDLSFPSEEDAQRPPADEAGADGAGET